MTVILCCHWKQLMANPPKVLSSQRAVFVVARRHRAICPLVTVAQVGSMWKGSCWFRNTSLLSLQAGRPLIVSPFCCVRDGWIVAEMLARVLWPQHPDDGTANVQTAIPVLLVSLGRSIRYVVPSTEPNTDSRCEILCVCTVLCVLLCRVHDRKVPTARANPLPWFRILDTCNIGSNFTEPTNGCCRQPFFCGGSTVIFLVSAISLLLKFLLNWGHILLENYSKQLHRDASCYPTHYAAHFPAPYVQYLWLTTPM